MNNSELLKTDDGRLTLSNTRCTIATEAQFEIETLCGIINEAVKKDEGSAIYAVRGALARIVELSHITTSCLDEPAESTDALTRRLRLEEVMFSSDCEVDA